MADIAPERVASIVLLSAIGVQEQELLGSYWGNHVLHGAQLGALWLLREGAPHFGVLDQFALDVKYARNFYDSDQRPLRSILQRYKGPMLILHETEIRSSLLPLRWSIISWYRRASQGYRRRPLHGVPAASCHPRAHGGFPAAHRGSGDREVT
jgi:hypothetical protein